MPPNPKRIMNKGRIDIVYNQQIMFGTSKSVNASESIENFESILNQHVAHSFSSLDLDNIFAADQQQQYHHQYQQQYQHESGVGGTAVSIGVANKQKQFQLQRDALTQKQVVIPEEHSHSHLERPGSLAKIDRASTLGSFSINHGSFNSPSRENQSFQPLSIPSNVLLPRVSQQSQQQQLNQLQQQTNFKVVGDRLVNSSAPNMESCQALSCDNSLRKYHSITIGSSINNDCKTNENGSNIDYQRGSEGTSKHEIVSRVSDINKELNASDSSNVTGSIIPAAAESAAPHDSSAFETGFVVMMPHENDVLMGRGGRNNQWSGNEKLRHLALELSGAYRVASKRNKPAIAWILVTKMRSLDPPGRFLKQDQAAGEWHVVDDDVAREKASQCLRDIVASRAKVSSILGNGQIQEDNEDVMADWGNRSAKADVYSAVGKNQLMGGGMGNSTADNCSNATNYNTNSIAGIDVSQSSFLDTKKRFSSAPNISFLSTASNAEDYAKRQRLMEQPLCTANAQFTLGTEHAVTRTNMNPFVVNTRPPPPSTSIRGNGPSMASTTSYHSSPMLHDVMKSRNVIGGANAGTQNFQFNLNNRQNNGYHQNGNGQISSPNPLVRRLQALREARAGQLNIQHELSNTDSDVRSRAEQLELLNHELQDTLRWNGAASTNDWNVHHATVSAGMPNNSGHGTSSGGGVGTMSTASTAQFSSLSQYLQQQALAQKYNGNNNATTAASMPTVAAASSSVARAGNTGSSDEDWALNRMLYRMTEE